MCEVFRSHSQHADNLVTSLYLILTGDTVQALQDELISKSFSGREGRGLQVSYLLGHGFVSELTPALLNV